MLKTILLVENNPDEVVLAKRAFSKAALDAQLIVADSGEAACDILLKNHQSPELPPELPHLVLLDLQMPGKDGLTVLRELRAVQRTRTLPVVMFTSSDEPDDINAGYLSGANGYLRKPVDFDTFVNLMQDVHQYWLVRNIPPAGGKS
jgi:two-component system response regulator